MRPHRFLLLVPLVALFLALAPSSSRAAQLVPAGPASMTLPRQALLVAKPRNLNRDAARQHNPAILMTTGRELVVAYEQDVPTAGVLVPDIFVTHSSDGISFASPVNLSRTPYKSITPFLFRANGNADLLYLEMRAVGNTYRLMSSAYSQASWTTPVRVDPTLAQNIIDPVGVQATDGSVWVAGQIYNGRTYTDTWVERVGSAGINLSNNGSAVRHPALVAGDNGQVYVAWIDHANEYGQAIPGINILRWTGKSWERLPIPSYETAIQWVSLAYYHGKLYLTWPSSVGTSGIKQRVWNGLSWSRVTVLAPGTAMTYLHTQVSPGGNVYVSWLTNGVVYLKRNADSPIVMSQGLPSAQEPALFVDDNDVAYVAFQQNYNIFLNTAR